MQESVAFRCHDCSPDVLLKFLPPRKDGRYPVDDPKAWLSPEWRWIPGYLETHGDAMTDYGRNWLNQKLQEGKDEAYQQALDACQSDLAAPAPPEPTTGVSLKVSSRLSGKMGTSGGEERKRAARLSVPFSPQTESVARVPLSVFWIGASATYDLNALNQAVQPVSGLYNANHPLSLRDVQLSSDGVVGAVVFQGHEFLPIPAGVEIQDDLRVEREAISFRLDFATEMADGGALDNWSVPINVSLPETRVGARFDFNWYYINGSWIVPPPPPFDWNALPEGCFADVTVRVLPSATARVLVKSGTDEEIGEAILSTQSGGSSHAWPALALHTLYRSWTSATPLTAPVAVVGTSRPSVTEEVTALLPACLAGRVSLLNGGLYPPALQDQYVKADSAELVDGGAVRAVLRRTLFFLRRDLNLDVLLDYAPETDLYSGSVFRTSPLRIPIEWKWAVASGGDFGNFRADATVTGEKRMQTAFTLEYSSSGPPSNYTETVVVRYTDESGNPAEFTGTRTTVETQETVDGGLKTTVTYTYTDYAANSAPGQLLVFNGTDTHVWYLGSHSENNQVVQTTLGPLYYWEPFSESYSLSLSQEQARTRYGSVVDAPAGSAREPMNLPGSVAFLTWGQAGSVEELESYFAIQHPYQGDPVYRNLAFAFTTRPALVVQGGSEVLLESDYPGGGYPTGLNGNRILIRDGVPPQDTVTVVIA